jgi:phosphoglycerol transferase
MMLMWLSGVGTVLLLAALAAAFRFAFNLHRSINRPRNLSLLLCIAGGLAAYPALGPLSPSLLPVALAVLLLAPVLVVEKAFGHVDLGAILFHAEFGMNGATLSAFRKDIRGGAAAGILILAPIAFLAMLWQPGPMILGAISFALLAVNPLLRDLAGQLFGQTAKGALAARLASPRLRSERGETPDLVILYLEGLDRRFADTSLYGDTYGPLQALAREGISFEKVAQVAGTGWSVAGMAATQSGVPLVPRGAYLWRQTGEFRTFMPTMLFLGDILQAKGYRNQYIVGAEVDFGGIGLMYRTHGVPALTGIDGIAARWPAEVVRAASIGEYVDDEMVLDTSLQLCAEALDRPEPHCLIVETIGPHGSSGYLSRGDTEAGVALRCADTRRSAAALARRALGFVREVQALQASRGRPVRIVVLSDHLCHWREQHGRDPSISGKNTVILLGGDHAPRVIDRAGSMPDVFPTILDWLGWAEAPVAAGLGRSLLSEPPTLVEEFGKPRLDRLINRDVRLSEAVWGDDPATEGG